LAKPLLTGGRHSVGIVRLRTEATEYFLSKSILAEGAQVSLQLEHGQNRCRSHLKNLKSAAVWLCHCATQKKPNFLLEHTTSIFMAACCQLLGSSLFISLFNPEDGGDTFL
jgi:hypothetical protein